MAEKISVEELDNLVVASLGDFTKGFVEEGKVVRKILDESKSNSDLWKKALAGYKNYNNKAASTEVTSKKDEYSGRAYVYGIVMEAIERRS